MTTVDSRIVTMKFENSDFQKGVSSTLNALSQLKDGLSRIGSSKGLTDLNAQAGKVDLTPISDQTHGVSKAFIAMSTVAITALVSMTTAVLQQGKEMAANLSGLNAMRDGWSDYELKIGATQTIMAGTGLSIGKVSKYLKELDIYADQTIYSLADMTSNIGKFTNAGVKLPVAVDALKGVAQVAAVAGANSGEAARAMYNLGQAIGAGHVKLMDWRSVELANMGTKEFKEQLIQTAVEMGTLKKSSDGTIKSLKGNVVNYKTFSQTLQDQWLTSKALTGTLARYADETTAIGKKATKAATEVKTFSMMLETLAAAAGTGWTDTFEILFGNLPKATKLWTGITDAVGGFIGRSADSRNEMLQGWKELGGRKALIEGFINIFKAFGAILNPIGKAFREVFPPSTGETLYKITDAFRNFTEILIVSEDTSKNIGSVFKAVFSVIGVGIDIIQGIARYFIDLIRLLSGLAAPVMNLAGSLGNLISKFIEWVGFDTSAISGFFDKIIEYRAIVFEPLIAAIGTAINYVADFVDSLSDGSSAVGSKVSGIGDKIESMVEAVKNALGDFDLGSIFEVDLNASGAATSAIDSVRAALTSAGKDVEKVKEAFAAVGAWLSTIGSSFMNDFAQPLWDAISGALDWVKGKLSGMSGTDAMFAGLFVLDAGILLSYGIMIRNFFKGISDIAKGFGDSARNMADVFGQLGDNLQALERQTKAETIMKIALALAVLAAAMWVLAKIDAKDLGKALAGLAGGMTIMMVAMAAMNKLAADTLKGAATQAVNVLAMSVAIAALGVALLAFALAVAIFGNMDTKTIVKGTTAIAASLAVIVGATAILSKTGGAGQMLVTAAAIGILALAMTAFAGAVKLYASFDIGTLASGTLKIAAALAILGLAMRLFPKGTLATAAGLFIVANALVILSGALALMGSMGGETMAKSLIMLAASLTIIAIALNAMTGAIGGAAAITLFAVALSLLVPPLMALGTMSMEAIGKSLLMLVGVFTVLGLASLVLAPVVPVIVALAGGIALLGLAAIAVGVGLLAFATGLAMLAASGAAGAAVLTAAVISIAATIPLIMAQFGLGLIAFAKVIAKAGPELVKAFTAVLNSILQAVINVTPKIGKVITTMLNTGLNIITNFVPKLIDAGIRILAAFLTGLERNIGQIVTKATNIIVKFLNALTNGVPKIARAGTDLIIAFIDAIADEVPRLVDAGMKAVIDLVNGVATAIDNNSGELRAAGGNLARAVIDGMTGGLASGISDIVGAASRMAGSAISAAKNVLDSHSPSREFIKIGKWVGEGFKIGLIGGTSDVKEAMQTMTGVLRSEMQKQKEAIKDEQAELDDLLDAKKRDEEAIAAARKRLAAAEEMYAASKSAHEKFTKDLKDERKELLGLAKDYDEVTTKIEEAKTALQDAIKTRNDAEAQVSSSFNRVPDITDESTVENYTEALKMEAEKNRVFLDSLNELAKMGLDDATYAKLLEEGVGIQPFIDELIAGGPEAVAAVDKATIELAKSAKQLGKQTSRELHQAGVDSARGLLNGLRSQKAAIAKEMREIANLISRTVRTELKINSPSREMELIGRYTNEGLAQGLDKYSRVVEKSAVNVAATTLDSIKSTMSKVSDAVSGELDATPVISPVLDLTQLKKGAAGIGGVLDAKTMAAQVTYGQAASVSSDRAAAQAESAVTAEAPVIKFEQNNYSPKALSAVEIYRSTRNQLSLAKEALTKS